jgi:hypothetical protein
MDRDEVEARTAECLRIPLDRVKETRDKLVARLRELKTGNARLRAKLEHFRRWYTH